MTIRSDELVFRTFLNKGKNESSLGAVSYSYQEQSYDNGKTWYTNGCVKISDCSRVVELDFCCGPDDIDAKISKAEVLEETFKKMAEFLKGFKKNRMTEE